MPGAIGDPRQGDDAIVYVDMLSTNNTAMRGDYLAFSGKSVIAVATGTPAAAYFPHSGIGIALAQNPMWDAFGSASANGKMPVGRRGIFRVSAVTANFSAGAYVFPVQTGSGVVGQTGRTGQGALWSATATLGGLLSANSAQEVSVSGGQTASGIFTSFTYSVDPTSAVGQIMRVVTNAATGQWDIVLLHPLTLAAPIVDR